MARSEHPPPRSISKEERLPALEEGPKWKLGYLEQRERDRIEANIERSRGTCKASRMTWLVWSLLSAVFAAATAVLAKIGVAGIDATLATAVRTSVVVVFTWILAYAATPIRLGTLPGKTWLFLMLSGIATGLSWVCYFHALQIGPASRVAPIDKLSVVLVIFFAALFLGERLTWARTLGGLLIMAGALVVAME